MNTYYHIQAAGTYQIDPTKGTLVRIIVNTTANGTIIVYDATTADPTKIIANFKASVVEQSFECGFQYATALTVVTAAASDITVVYT